MKRFAFLFFFAGWLVPLASAQESEHIQVGIFADFFRQDQISTNFGGLGGRVAVRAFHNIKLEGETSYDFASLRLVPAPSSFGVPACALSTASLVPK